MIKHILFLSWLSIVSSQVTHADLGGELSLYFGTIQGVRTHHYSAQASHFVDRRTVAGNSAINDTLKELNGLPVLATVGLKISNREMTVLESLPTQTEFRVSTHYSGAVISTAPSEWTPRRLTKGIVRLYGVGQELLLEREFGLRDLELAKTAGQYDAKYKLQLRPNFFDDGYQQKAARSAREVTLTFIEAEDQPTRVSTSLKYNEIERLLRWVPSPTFVQKCWQQLSGQSAS